MIRLGINVLIFGIFFLIITKIVGRFDNIDRETSTNPNIIRIANAHRFDSLDILFVGSSASYSGIDPTYFDSLGLRCYNLSTAAAGPYFYELLVNDYLKSVRKKPKMVFLLVMPHTFSDKVDDFYEIGIHRYLAASVSNEKIIQEYNGWQTYPQLLLKSFQKGIKNLVFMQKASAITLANEIKDRGFYRSDDVTSAKKEKKEFPTYADWKLLAFEKNKLSYLEKLSASLEQQGIKVVFFSLPANRSNSFFSENYMAEYKAGERKIKESYSFIDLSSMQLDSIAYRNVDHLNTYGASVVTSELITEIINNTELRVMFHLPDSIMNKYQNR